MKKAREAAIRGLLDQARRAAGGGAALASALRAADVGPDSGAYSESAVSNWIKGRTRPPADVLVTAATLYGLSLDAAFNPLPTPQTASPDHEASGIHSLRDVVSRLESLIPGRPEGTNRTEEQAVKDVRRVFATRSELQASLPVLRLLAASEHAEAMGLSLNVICQGVSDVTLTELIENGLTLRCLFLDPDSGATRAREVEERHPAGHLADLTRSNMLALARVRDGLSDQAKNRLSMRVYSQPLRFNITSFDGERSLVQLYLPQARGVDSPTLLIEADEREPHGLFSVFEQVLASTWDNARVVES